LKIIAICQALDLSNKKLGITPAWWQILKGLAEQGVEVIAIPYFGKAVESLWWKCYENPNLTKISTYEKLEQIMTHLPFYKDQMSFRQKNQGSLTKLINLFIKPKWKKYLEYIIKKEKDIDAIIVLTVPLNQFEGIPEYIEEEFDIPVYYYDGDTPTSLPEHGGISVSFYDNVDISEYEAFFINSKGSVSSLKEMGAKKVNTIYWGVDPSAFAPLNIKKEYDIGFYGIGDRLREKSINFMIGEPSKIMNSSFVVVGKGFGSCIGNAKYIDADKIRYNKFYSQCRISLNISRKPHATVFGSSISRIFELASMECCIVTNPHNGIQEWFEPNKELIIVNDLKEALETYSCLLDSVEIRESLGQAARKRVLKEHTYEHRCSQLLNIINAQLLIER
jgi:spore maturation protein CgeB